MVISLLLKTIAVYTSTKVISTGLLILASILRKMVRHVFSINCGQHNQTAYRKTVSSTSLITLASPLRITRSKVSKTIELQ